MAMLMQKVGRVQLRTFTDGWPLRIELTDLVSDRQPVVLSVDDLHDLGTPANGCWPRWPSMKQGNNNGGAS